MAYATVYFPSNNIALFNVNWLSLVKVRTTLIGGGKKMLVWNDAEADEQIEVLQMETQHFVDCIAKGKRPISDGQPGLRVVKLLEASNGSLRESGSPVKP